jgi:hypothetical protein
MPKRNFSTLEEFKANLHRDGATLVEFSGNKIPCLLISQKEYDDLIQSVFGRKIRTETLLDIFYDGQDVFVDIQITCPGTSFDRNYLVYANDMMEFFEALADSGLLAIAPDSQRFSNSQTMFTIQLPKRDAAENALQIIKSNSNKRVSRP